MTGKYNRRIIGEGPDFYPTPAWATEALLRHVKFQGNILEPCCGEGDMSEVLIKAGYKVFSSDKYDRGYGEKRNFLTLTQSYKSYDNIVTNPPFNIAEDVLSHALVLARRKVCLLLRLAFLESRSRYERFYSRRPPSKVLIFSERLSMYPKGHPVNGGGVTAYGWFVWDNGFVGVHKPTTLEWIAPGHKPGRRAREIGSPGIFEVHR
jgi:hypothetical protein